MNIVVDTNIVFSAIVNTNGLIGDLLFNSPHEFYFVSPEFMYSEIIRCKSKLQSSSKLSEEKLSESMFRVLSQIELVSEGFINPKKLGNGL